MNVVILGADRLGVYVANVLSKEEFNVTLIDSDPWKIAIASREGDFATQKFTPSNWTILEELLETKPHCFLALTENDDTNLAACSIAKNLGFPLTICRVGHSGYLRHGKLNFHSLFSVDHFIGTEILAAYQIFKTLLSPSHLHIEEFAHGAIVLRTCIIPEKWQGVNKPLKELSLPKEMIIGLIQRKEEEKDILIFPHGEDVIKPGDIVTVIGDTKEMQNIKTIFSLEEEQISHVVIVGGSQVGLNLAHLLIKYGIEVKIMEKDEERCHFLAEQIPNATILNHDAKDINFLRSENVDSVNAFITCMHHDEENLLVSAMGKEAGCNSVIALITDTSLAPALKRIGVAHSFSEKIFTTDRILSILHSKNILSIYSLADDRAKVVEIKVSPDSRIANTSISELGPHLPKEMLIAMIESQGKVTIGKGNCIIKPNDTVILLASPEKINEIRNFF